MKRKQRIPPCDRCPTEELAPVQRATKHIGSEFHDIREIPADSHILISLTATPTEFTAVIEEGYDVERTPGNYVHGICYRCSGPPPHCNSWSNFRAVYEMQTSIEDRADQFKRGAEAIGARYGEAIIWVLSLLQNQLHPYRNPALLFMDYDFRAYMEERHRRPCERISKLMLEKRLQTFKNLFELRCGESNDELDEDMEAISVHDRVIEMRDVLRRL
jgi:hypothetical protein